MSEEQKKSADRLKAFTESKELSDRMGRIKHKIMILSGKGGVGKSTVATNVAVSLAMEGKRVGLLDSDFHGPSIPTLLNMEGQKPSSDGESILPVDFAQGIKVMSMGFLLPNRDDAVIWRGPMKMNVLKQLLTEVNWGDLDYLIIDFPPGTGDEPLSVAQLLPDCDGAVIVTTPQDLSVNDVRKCINFCRQVNVPVIGVIENMSGLRCPNCGTVIDIFKAGGGEKMAEEMNVSFLGRIPLDPQIVEASDNGKPFVYHYNKTDAAKAFSAAIDPILSMDGSVKGETKPAAPEKKATGEMKIAIPLAGGRLSVHFGHCEEFALFDVDVEKKEIVGQEKAPAPEDHEPGTLPNWLIDKGVNMVIVSGMGSRAKGILEQRGVKVNIGAPSDDPEIVIKSYLDGSLEFGENICDH
ncbi:MAG: iron-sulfur cluster carrier protein MrpORP [Thermodesulfobacteriota bacterium]|nr:iron-sulfur cluster carrier protein MrpORP [Thermodesulfobacteriota bacterium]